MIHAYDRLYLDDVMTNLGVMMDYGVNSLGFRPCEILSKFISSGVAAQIEKGHPRYLSGFSGIELACLATGLSGSESGLVYPGPEYWAGWAIAYLQWESGYSFSTLEMYGFGIEDVISMYNPYHEADISKFYDEALARIRQKQSCETSRLKLLRKAARLSQEALAQKIGVPVRTIRSYEQNSRSITKAESGILYKISRALGCPIESLLE